MMRMEDTGHKGHKNRQLKKTKHYFKYSVEYLGNLKQFVKVNLILRTNKWINNLTF